jgi:uncharacterized protein involved in type VI secretion and phage assembly
MNIPHSLGQLNSLHIAKVLDNVDPERRGRIQVQLQTADMQFWAIAMAASAGQGYGISFLPKIDELVILAFISPERPIVLGALWSGSSSKPEDSEPVEARYAIQTPSGLQLTFDDENGPNVEVQTPSGNRVRITDGGGGEINIEMGSEMVKMSSGGIEITSSSKVKIEAPQVEVQAAMVKVDAGFSQFSGVVKCDTLIANSVVSTSYTPGAGNIW